MDKHGGRYSENKMMGMPKRGPTRETEHAERAAAAEPNEDIAAEIRRQGTIDGLEKRLATRAYTKSLRTKLGVPADSVGIEEDS